MRFTEALARDRTKRMFLNDEPGMVTSTIIDINPVELKSYPLMISLNKCTGIFNGLSPKHV